METISADHTVSNFTIPRSQYEFFCRSIVSSGLGGRRWGQAFYQFMNFEKIHSKDFKAWAEKLYQESSQEKAVAMVLRHLDHDN